MFAINKCLISFNIKNCIFNNQFKLNRISTKLQKRYFNSTKIHKKFNIILSNQSVSECETRFLSSNGSVKPSNPKSDDALNSRSNGLTPTLTTTTSAPSGLKGLADERAANELAPKGTVVQPIGIVGIHKWDSMRNVRKWICVYGFPYITHIRTFQKMKVWLTFLSCALVPITYSFYSMGSTSLETCSLYSLICLFSLFMMYFFGTLFSRFVGRVYISENHRLVRLSHLSFWGNRIDTDIDASDIVPLTDSNFKLNDWYCTIERYSNDDKRYMSLKFGGVMNREAFDAVFGEDSHKLIDREQ